MLFANELDTQSEADTPERAVLKVLIADAHDLVRGGLKLCVQAAEKHASVLEADSLDAAIATFRTRPGIGLVLLDLNLSGSQGVSALDRFAHAAPEARLVVMSENCDMKTVQSALARGARGCISRLAGRADFVNALRFVVAGGTYIPSEALLPAANAAAQCQPALEDKAESAAPLTLNDSPAPRTRAETLRGARLTARQIDVLAQLLDGKPNKQICRELNLALGTVKCHVGAILGALEVNTRAEAIAAANKRGWHQWLAQQRSDNRLSA